MAPDKLDRRPVDRGGALAHAEAFVPQTGTGRTPCVSGPRRPFVEVILIAFNRISRFDVEGMDSWKVGALLPNTRAPVHREFRPYTPRQPSANHVRRQRRLDRSGLRRNLGNRRESHCPISRPCNSARQSSFLTRHCSSVSRLRIVTVPSVIVWPSTVMQKGVPTSSWRR